MTGEPAVLSHGEKLQPVWESAYLSERRLSISLKPRPGRWLGLKTPRNWDLEQEEVLTTFLCCSVQWWAEMNSFYLPGFWHRLWKDWD